MHPLLLKKMPVEQRKTAAVIEAATPQGGGEAKRSRQPRSNSG